VSERSFGTRGDTDAVRLSGRIVSQAAVLSDARKGGSIGGKEARWPSGCERSGPAEGWPSGRLEHRLLSEPDKPRILAFNIVALGRRDTRWNGPAA